MKKASIPSVPPACAGGPPGETLADMAMRISEFWANVDDVFGAVRGRSLASDLSLTGVGSRTAAAALDEGVAPQRVWDALCAEMDLPETYRFLHQVDDVDRKQLGL